MRAVDIIIKKRDRQALTAEEIQFFIRGYTKGEIADYQAAAFAMAVLLNGMNDQEITDLTLAMAHSGRVIDLSQSVAVVVDKHSTGGVGDKTTLVVEPVVAACGLPVGKMSGRGLGFSGGTLDKMESIPGFRTNLSTEEFIEQLQNIGLVLTGQSDDLAPADGKLYALRDVTGTVQCIPLIASSVMSKKIAAGAQAILLDVKVGLGAFMQTLDEARALAKTMTAIARLAGRKATALISDMNQPLGCAVGNALELKEAIATLQGGGPPDFREHCLEAAAHLFVLGGITGELARGRELAEAALDGGQAWQMFRRLVEAQGGEVNAVDHPELLPAAALQKTCSAPLSGYVRQIHARLVGESVVQLGGGRSRKEDAIDYGVGVEILHKVGDFVPSGEALFTVHASSEETLAQACEQILAAHQWSDAPVAPLPLFYETIE